MIPKTLHYIWLGNCRKSNITNICINSWYDRLPEYEIIEWNETNLDLDQIASENKFFAECRKRKLWAFMADYLRLYILYHEGGIYVDTDVQVLKPLDAILDHQFVMSYEYAPMWGKDAQIIGSGVLAAEKGSPALKAVLDFYNEEIWNVDFYTIPMILDHVLKQRKEKDFTVYPAEYFAPFSPEHTSQIDVQRDQITENTFCIHWYSGSWMDNLNVRMFLKCKHIKNPVKKKLVQVKLLSGYVYKKCC